MKNKTEPTRTLADQSRADFSKPQPAVANVCLDSPETFSPPVNREPGMEMSGQIVEKNYKEYAAPSALQLKHLSTLHQGWFSSPVQQLTFGGIDGGSSGAFAFLFPDGNWEVRLVSTFKDRSHWLLSVDENRLFLKQMAALAGGRDKMVLAYERSRKNVCFGIRNSHVNGRNEEFWRVLLALQKMQHCSVDPKTWQSICLKGIGGDDTKARAREYIRRRCPNTEWLDTYNKAPREAIVDAMCIALWCKDQHQAGESVNWILPSALLT